MRAMDALQADCFDPEFYSRHVADKAAWARRLLPAGRVIDAGGMWGCNGYYSFLAASEGAGEVVLLDGMATDKFKAIAPRHPKVKWIQADFHQALTTGGLAAIGAAHPAEGLILFDVMLHQPEPILLLATLVKAFGARRVAIANPARRKSAGSSEIAFIPRSGLFAGDAAIHQSKQIDDRSGWVWLLSHGFVLNACRYVGLRVVDEILVRRWAGNEALDYSIVLAEREEA